MVCYYNFSIKSILIRIIVFTITIDGYGFYFSIVVYPPRNNIILHIDTNICETNIFKFLNNTFVIHTFSIFGC